MASISWRWPAPRARGCDRQTPHGPVRAGPPVAGVDQDRPPDHPGGRRRRLHRGGGAAQRQPRRAPDRRVHDDGKLRYLGHVGTGFTEAALQHLLGERPLERPSSPFDEEVPRDEARKARWVHPQLVGEVVYRVLTAEGRLRHAAWRGLRTDKTPEQARLP